jgi:hypothetical protein
VFWLLLLRIYLFALIPANFALESMKTLPSLELRGAPAIAELIVHGVAAALAAAAGWMIYVRNPAAPSIALVAVIANAITTLQTIFWSFLPHDIAPGRALPLAALTILHAVAWSAYLRRSPYVKRVFGAA